VNVDQMFRVERGRIQVRMSQVEEFIRSFRAEHSFQSAA
jgi:hypothetical protein